MAEPAATGNGNGKALTPERVFRDYAPRVYALARRMLGNDADAEDVAQDVLVEVVRKLHTFRCDSDIFTWLHPMTVHAALAHRAKRARQHQHESAEPLNHFLEDGGHSRAVRSWSVAPDQEVLGKEREKIIEDAIAKLPEVYRDVYVLADVERLSNPEIGQMLDLSVPAVKSRLHRGRLLMRDALAPHFEEMTI
jgi:RNA polymerase sigma-70 factor (ECF subfamily)